MPIVNALETSSAAPVARQMARDRSKDRLTEFLSQGAEESPDQLAGKYGQLFDSGGGFGFGTASSLGGDNIAAGAINDRMRDLLNKNVGYKRANLLRGATSDYQDRMSQYQSVHDAVTRQRQLEERIAAEKKAAKKAKAAGMSAVIGGLVGAGGGALATGGSPYGAMIGSGIGSSIGGQIG